MPLFTGDEEKLLVNILLKLPNVTTDEQVRRDIARSLPEWIVRHIPFSNAPYNDMVAIVRAGNAASPEHADSPWPIQQLVEGTIKDFAGFGEARELRALLDGALERRRQSVPPSNPDTPPPISDILPALHAQVVTELEDLAHLRAVLDMNPPPIARLRQLSRVQVLKETIVPALEQLKHTDTELRWMPETLAIKRLDDLRRAARSASLAFAQCLRAIDDVMALKSHTTAYQRRLVEAQQAAAQADEQCKKLRDLLSECLRERDKRSLRNT